MGLIYFIRTILQLAESSRFGKRGANAAVQRGDGSTIQEDLVELRKPQPQQLPQTCCQAIPDQFSIDVNVDHRQTTKKVVVSFSLSAVVLAYNSETA